MGKKYKGQQRAILLVSMLWIWTAILWIPAAAYADETGGVSFGEPEVTMTPATMKKLSLSGAPDGAEWASSDEEVATVDGLGNVLAKKKGSAVITAVVDGTEYACNVQVAYGMFEAADGLSYKDAKGNFACTGRWYKKKVGSGRYYFTNTDGSAIYFKTAGSKYVSVNFISNTLHGMPYFAYSVDGGRMNRQLINKKKIKVGNSRKTHYVRLLIDSTSEYENRWGGGAGVAVKSIVPVTKGGVVTAIQPQNEVIAFYGDSITKGVRTLDMGTPSGTSVINSYAWHCAKKLKMMPYLAGFGASGIIQQGTADSCINVIDKFASSVKASAFTADVIVVAHGTNDVYTQGDLYVNEYRRVLERLHALHPNAQIMAMIPMTQIHAEDIRAAAMPYRQWCSVVETASLGLSYTDGLHPNASGSRKLGLYLAKQIAAVRRR